MRGRGWVVLGPVGRLVGGVGRLYGCEADAVVSLDLGSVVSMSVDGAGGLRGKCTGTAIVMIGCEGELGEGDRLGGQ